MSVRMQKNLEHNMIAKFSYVAKCKDSMECLDTDYGILINANMPCDMFNIVAALNVNSVAELKSLFNPFTQSKLPFALWTGFADENQKTQQSLAQIKLPAVEKEVGMYADISDIRPVKADAALVIEAATTKKHIQDIIRVMAELLPDDADAISSYFNKIANMLISTSSKLTFFLGYIDNKPVATSSLYRDTVCAGIWDIITLPDVRRRGIGTAMTYSAILQAKSEGYDTIVLTASDDGFPVYEKIGFQKLNSFKVYNFQA